MMLWSFYEHISLAAYLNVEAHKVINFCYTTFRLKPPLTAFFGGGVSIKGSFICK